MFLAGRLNVLDFPSVQEAVKTAEARQRRLTRLMQMTEPLSETEAKLAERWIQKMNGKEATDALPVSMLPAQKRRILSLWERDLSDVIQFAVHPIPIPQHPTAEAMEAWHFAHTLALFRRHLQTQTHQ